MLRLFSGVKAWMQPYVQGFFRNRSPKSDKVLLNAKNVYVFFNRNGGFFVLLLVATFIAGVNYGNNLVLGLCFYLSSLWLIALTMTFLQVSGLQVKLVGVDLGYAGQAVWANIEITNGRSKPKRNLCLQFDQALDHPMAVQNRVVIGELSTTTQIRLPIWTKQRGELPLPRLIVSSLYPLGIMRAWSYVYFAQSAWVAPKPLPFDTLNLATPVLSEADHHFVQSDQVGQNDFDKLDEYVLGESLAKVSWRHLARGQGLLTKHFVDSGGQEEWLDYDKMPAIGHEDKLSQLAYALDILAKNDQAFRLNLPNDLGQVGQGRAFVAESLLRLAKAP